MTRRIVGSASDRSLDGGNGHDDGSAGASGRPRAVAGPWGPFARLRRVARRGDSSKGTGDAEGTGKAERKTPRIVRGGETEAEQAGARRGETQRRKIVGSAGDSHAVARKPSDVDVPSGSDPGQFVDARDMPSEDAIARTLKETSSPLGIVSRPKVVDFTARFRERRRAHMLAAASRVAIVVAVVSAVAALLWVALFSPVFRLEVSGISVSGQNAWVTTSQVMAIASKQAGRSVFLVSSSDVVDQLRNIPGVTGATATKHLPNRLAVTVTAQRPVAMLRTSDGTLTAVDSKGRILNSVSGTSSSGIPVIDVTDVKSALRRDAIKETLAILSSLPESLRQRVSSVVTKTQDSITTGLDKGKYTIIWGDSSDLALKKAVVNTLLSDSNALGSHTEIDVSAPTRPILK